VSRSLRILIAAVAAIAAVAGYYKLALAPKRHEAAALEQQLTTAQTQLATAQSTIATYKHAKAAYPADYATVVRLGKAAPADDDSRSLLVQLDYAAKHSGVDFSNIDVSSSSGSSSSSSAPSATTGSTSGTAAPGAVSAGNYSEIPFSLAFQGTFGGLSNFFGRLQRFVTVQPKTIGVSGRLLRVLNIDIEPGEGGWPAISAKIGATAYIVAPAQGLGAGSASSASSATPASTPSSTSTASTTTASDLR
jgi:Tfp pilus assembly protein PilO